MMGKEDGGMAGMINKLEERDPSQTTIHVLSTPSLTGPYFKLLLLQDVVYGTDIRANKLSNILG